MSRRAVSIALIAILTILTAVLAFSNPTTVALTLAGTALASVPLGVTLGVTYALGLLAGLSVLWSQHMTQQVNSEKLEEWGRQDAKLAASVQTDREKQLEAKIATLEAALQRALKK